MKIIAHRANLYGPDPEKENTLNRINECINLGFDVEIDLWLKNNTFFLGHDEAQNEIDLEQILSLSNKIWIHCKNIQVLENFLNQPYGRQLNFFWHQKDSYTLTSQGFIWAYPGSKLSFHSIFVMPEWIIEKSNLFSLSNHNISGVCSDFPMIISK
tara:strand:+ start:650 stop:1117 length:468 start_codon:yes stop_codon:yes gene_type:complete